jgi:hypothetical protein
LKFGELFQQFETVLIDSEQFQVVKRNAQRPRFLHQIVVNDLTDVALNRVQPSFVDTRIKRVRVHEADG